MSSLSDKIALVQSSILSDEPWASGSIEVPNHFLKLFYTDKDKEDHSHTVLLNKKASVEDLIHLSDTCQPASFGRGPENVLDESYRKAGKLDTSSFASPFGLHDTNILQTVVTKLFKGQDANAPAFAELYKLNVYGPGSFFKAHTDTPRGNKLFGSLVIVFPTLHTGGSLALRHKKKEFIFDSSSDSKLFDTATDTVAYVAFFSDVEHEILPVTEGYRVTLTYNLYRAEHFTKTPLLTNEIVTLMRALRSLIQDPTFLPRGGLLGFGLNFAYPVNVGSSSFDDVAKRLKGSDEVISIACAELGLPVNIRAVCQDKWPNAPNMTYVMLPAPLDLGSVEVVDAITYPLLRMGGEVIHPMDSTCATYLSKISKEVAWITPITKYSSFESPYLENGNEAYLGSFYAEVCLMVPIGAAGDRANLEV